MEPLEPSVITAIEPQVRHADRVSVFVDGEFTAGMHVEVAAAAGLRVGLPISAEDLKALARAEELRRVRESALYFLGHRARSEQEMRRRLARHGYDPELIDEALLQLKRGGLVDDAEFSQSWVQARTGSRPYGRNRLTAELRQKGVDREQIDQALEQVSPEAELELALRVGRQKLEHLRDEEPVAAGRKLTAALMRRGFGWSICARVRDRLLGESDETE
jgi:regulatory protein